MSTTETKLAQNRVFAKNLGWKPTDIGATDFNTLLVTLIAAQQQIIGTDVDGVCGPKTYGGILAHKQAALMVDIAKASGDEKLRLAGELVVCELKRAWLTDILDLPAKSSPDYERCRSFIDDLIRTAAGIHWYWEEPYPSGYKWCGTFAAKGWAAARVPAPVRQKFFSSTYRLDRWFRYRPIDADPKWQNKPPLAQAPMRKIIELDEHSKPTDAFFGTGDPPRAGDIALVGPVGSKMAYGQHVTVIESFDAQTGIATTLEGNGTGLDPHGVRQHGVVRAQRTVGLQGANPSTYHIRRIGRPGLHDIEST